MAQAQLSLPDALDRALACHRAGDLGQAERLYGAILAASPDHGEALHLLGLIAHQGGHHETALGLVDRAIATGAEAASVLNNRGLILQALHRPEEALASYEHALALRPDLANAHNNRGNAFRVLRRFEEALASYERALALRPDYAEALNNRGVVLHDMKRFDEALASYERALALRPDYAETLYNHGTALYAMKRFDEALASYAQALALRPDAKTLSNRGVVLHEMKRFDEALASYVEAEAIDPDFADAHLNKAHCRLLLGDLARGWTEYEWRWKAGRFAPARRNFSAPLWLGKEDLTGKTILLHGEQGFGDTIQFCRYVPLVAATGATVILEVPPPLLPLLRDFAGVAQLKAQGDDLPAFAFHCPLLSLPLAFGTRIETIPAPIPYLYAPPDRIDKMAALLPPASFRIGLVWSGNPAPRNGSSRSIALECLAPLLGLAGIGYVSLQRDLRPEDRAALARYPNIVHLGPQLGDFADTAAVLAALDLVITIDTVVAHLAGAMGKPVWLLLSYVPDWRWLLDREDSPWYPSARLFRQPALGDWDAVIARVATELSRFAAMPRDGKGGSDGIAQARLSLPDALDRALACHRAGDLGQAERLYRAILAASPDHGDALHGLGLIAHQGGHDETALGLVDRAIAAGAEAASVLNNRGLILQALHRPEEALASYERALALRPDHAEALSNRGLALHHLQRFDAALESYDQALALRPDFVDALSNRGNAFHALQRFEEALASHDAVLALQPNQAEAHFDRAAALKELWRFEEALAGYDRALSLRPDFAEAHYMRGLVLHELKQFAAALASYERALALRPDLAAVLRNCCGITLNALKRHDEALASFDVALELQPDFADAHNNRGNTFRVLRRFEEALASYAQALALRPDYADALNNRGVVLREMKRFDEALGSYERALALRPDYTEALYNRGMMLHDMKRFDEALASYAQALALRPDDAKTLTNRGVVLHDMKRFDEALASYVQAEAIDPDLAEIHWDKGLCHLLLGDLTRGWVKYEWRWKTDYFAPQRRNFSAPLWLGSEDLAGKTILLHAEQGFGDTIQFCRYVPLVAATGATVILEVPPPLLPLLHDLAGVAQLKAGGEELPAFDFHCPLLSLPLAFGTVLETIPASVPYLHASPDRIDKMAALLPPASFRVGLVWSGNSAHLNDRNRSVALERLAPLLGLAGIGYVSLQCDVRPEDAAALARRPAIMPLGPHLGDFADTAAAVAALDLVITVDTAVAHLAGAMGKPVWVLLLHVPDWRWLLDREDSPWYPSARLFRQLAPGDWDQVIARVATELFRFAAMPRGGKAGLSLPDALDRAIACHRAGDLGQAERLYRAILAASPDHGDALHGLGLIAHQGGHHETALELVDQAIAAGAESADVLSNRGLILQALHRPEEALASYERALALRPNHAEALSNRGLALHHLQRFDAALESYDKSLALRPDFADALNNRGRTLRALRRFEEALASYDAVLALRPNRAETHYDRATALKALGRLEEALAGYDHVLALQPDFAEALNERGIVLSELKQFEAALASYERALELRPDLSDALNNRGNAFHALQRFEEALASYDAVLALQPNQAETHCNRATVLKDLRRFEEALAGYDRALALRPDFADAFYMRGIVLYELKQYEAALASYERALVLRSDFASAHHNRGLVLHELKQYEAALESYERALALRPDLAAVLRNCCGITLNALKRHDEALASFDVALELQPDFADAHNNRGNAFHVLRRFEEALASYERALSLRPDYAEALSNRGVVLHDMKRFDEALGSYAQALALRPDYTEALSNRGVVLHDMKRFDEALASYAQALALRPDAKTLINRGAVLHDMKRFDEALASYVQAEAIDPDFAEAHWNEALCRLRLDDFARGWAKYEWRWKTDYFAPQRRNFSAPLWLGSEDLAGKTILLHAEQGFGDTIQFCRYVPLVAATGATIILEVPPPLLPLLRDFAGVAQLKAGGEELPAFDFHCPLLSLPLAFGTVLETIPAPVPYLHATADRIDRMAALLPPASFRVGLVWSGNPAHLNDRNRSIALERLAPLLGLAGIGYVSLQRDVRPEDEAALTRYPDIVHLGPHLGDFADTAAALAALDLVITVDTAVAHLAGAMGKSVWILLSYVPDWRWLLDRDDSPWYPSARLFRQPAPGDWDSVVTQVRDALKEVAQVGLVP